MDFEWNRAKAALNERKHAVGFEQAAEIFADIHSATVPDPDHSIDEEHFLIFGRTRAGKFLVAAFTERDGTIRIINARRMTRRERKAYEQ